MNTDTCLLCGLPMPPRRWWQHPALLGGPPTHDPDGKDGLACWKGLCVRMGLDPNIPPPRRLGSHP